MKYLKKFNESKESDFYNDIQDCFIDFIDRDDAYLEKEVDYIILSFSMEEQPENTNVGSLKKFYQKNLSIINEIEIGFKRLKDIYPDFHYESGFYENELHFEIYKSVEEGDFYKRTGDLIILDYNKIKEILKLDKEVIIYYSTSGTKDYLTIDFKNKDHFIKNMYRGNFPNTNDMLIFDFNHHNLDIMRLSSDFDKLVIDDKKLITRINSVKKGEEVKFYGVSGRGSETRWSVYLLLNNDLNIT